MSGINDFLSTISAWKTVSNKTGVIEQKSKKKFIALAAEKLKENALYITRDRLFRYVGFTTLSREIAVNFSSFLRLR